MQQVKLVIGALDETFWTGTFSEAHRILAGPHDAVVELMHCGIINSFSALSHILSNLLHKVAMSFTPCETVSLRVRGGILLNSRIATTHLPQFFPFDNFSIFNKHH